MSAPPPSTPPRREFNIPPRSPGFSPGFNIPSSPSSPARHLRPDHSTLVLPSTTTPIVSPPPSPRPLSSRTPSPLPEFTDKYGGYGLPRSDSNRSLRPDEDLLLSTSVSPKKRRSPPRTMSSSDRDAAGPSTLLLLVIVLLGMIAFFLLLSAMGTRVSEPTKRVAAKLKPLVPSVITRLLRTSPTAAVGLHPILTLITSSRLAWSKKLGAQSTTFDKFSKTYIARYNRPVPPGMDKWFAFATQGRNHSLVNEYDTLMQDLLPYRSLTPQELRRRTAELASVPGISIVSIRNGVAQVHSKSGKWAPASAFQQMLSPYVKELPDMDIAINEKPEGRVLPRRRKEISWADFGLEEQLALGGTLDPSLKPSLKNFTNEWKRDGSVWDAYRESCPDGSASRRSFESLRSAESGLQIQGRPSAGEMTVSRRRGGGEAIPAGRELSFAADVDAQAEICSMPSMHTLHSAFYSDQRSIEQLFPVFSASKPSGYADILIPSHHYWQPSSEFTYEWELKRGRTKVPTDLDWEEKTPTAYWRGKVTKGADTPPGHSASFQKQRLVKLANQPISLGQETVLVQFNATNGALSSIRATVAESNKQMTDIAMACDPNLGECAALRDLGYRVEAPAPLSQTWNHKYVLDLDEIGFSPKFLALMESKSAVVKNSIQREFWRGWIQPWYHYIPLSSSYSELYNIQSFFSGIPEPLLMTKLENDTLVPRPMTPLTKPPSNPEISPLSSGAPFEGDAALKEIAMQGSQWRTRHVRKEDMECYVYRLMVEWANILAGDKERAKVEEIAKIAKR
ncbi:BZ3500_MvSof-1268-A1-R1_Chr2-1g04298 [Microbotryum saponariae]|uniref:BZ3500_MvSof-1268-A1-R1_Chr2-1g04298 protein n=1 Tax=Microbotryum saponariae TaxID=289078 RepID=A0A2X0KAB4_9BASI|nr:BZ3500_MvSof-1268-A1-R1_Chr2-1g04298 [Microbotryum saponariae]SCZ91363.1 BZ3501_MvSof-1269-A2-R1_Chr2-1g03954 [Microbotryum saponariae]